MNKQISFKTSIYTVSLRLQQLQPNNDRIIIDAHSQHYHKNFHGQFKNTDLPDLYLDLYGGCDTVLQNIPEWLDSHQPNELTDTGNLIFTYQVHLGKKGSTKRKLQFQLNQCQVTEIERLHLTIKQLEGQLKRLQANEKSSINSQQQILIIQRHKKQIEQLASESSKKEQQLVAMRRRCQKQQQLISSLQEQSEKLKQFIKQLQEQQNRISPIIDGKNGFLGMYTLVNGAINCSMKVGRWMPVCLTQAIKGNIVFDIECLQTPANAMFGIVCQDNRSVQDCHMMACNFFLHVRQQSMHRYTDENGCQLADLLIRTGDRIRIRVSMFEMWIRWYHVRNVTMEEILKVSISERLKYMRFYPCLMIDATNEKYRFL